MRSTLIVLLLLACASLVFCQSEKVRLGTFEFFGVNDYDVSSLRAALHSYEGRELSETEAKQITIDLRDAVNRITGRPPTDVDLVCCDAHGEAIFYVGLAHRTSGAEFRYKPAPAAPLRLPDEVLRLYDEAMDLNVESVQRNASEDRSKGYALSSYLPMRARQLAAREYALAHDQLLKAVLLRSADVKQRRSAAYLLGYGRQSKTQITTLVSASRDPDETVRNNAVRALAVLAHSSAAIAASIPAESFIGMLNSGTWTDRNKGSFLLAELTSSRSPRLLHQLRARALPALIEMARWRNRGHAHYSRLILGRIAGIPEAELVKLVEAGDAEGIISRARSSH
jgi:hypothetical protein